MRRLLFFTFLLIACEDKPSTPTLYDDPKKSVVIKVTPSEESCDHMLFYHNWMVDPVTQRCAWYFNKAYNGAITVIERNCEPILKLSQFASVRHCWRN